MLTTAVVLWQQKAIFQFEKKKMLFTKLAILEQFGYSFIDFGHMWFENKDLYIYVWKKYSNPL